MDEKKYNIDLAEMAEVLQENRKPITRMTGCVIIAGIVYLMIAWYLFPRYESVAKLQIIPTIPANMTVMMTGGASPEQETYAEIIKSRGVVTPVIKATEKPNFLGGLPRYEDYVKKKIKTESVALTEILNVSVSGETPEKAQRANQLLVDGFLKRVGELNSTRKGNLKAFLTERVAIAKEDLDKAETALQKFKEENKILSPSASAEIFTERIMDVEKQAAANKVELEAAEARLAAINQQLSGSGASAADNVTLQQYNEELAKLETTRIAYRDKYTEKHPRMIEINERIENLKAKIQEELDKIANLQAPSDNQVHQGLVAGKYSSEGAVKVARQKAEALQKIIDQNNAELVKLPAMEQEYVRLTRDYGVANEIYMMLVKQLENTKITEFQQPMNVLLVDAPNLPDKPAFPRRGLGLVLIVFLGLMLSTGYVLLDEIRNLTIRNRRTLIKYTGLPVLGEIYSKDNLEKDMNVSQNQKENAFLNKLRDFIWKN